MAYSLAIDIGNTNTSIGVFKYGHLLYSYNINNPKTPDITYFMESFKKISSIHSEQIHQIISTGEFEGGLISSVVPYLSRPIQLALETVFGINIPVLDSTYKNNISFDVDDPSEIGSDIICDLAYATELYKDSTLIFDLGTVTKYMVIDKHRKFVGAGFVPGFDSTIHGFHDRTALLPEIQDFTSEDVVLLGKNTKQCMINGIYYTTLEGLLGTARRIEEQLGYHLKKVITGGCAYFFKEELSGFFYDKDFTLKGVKLIFDLNR